MFDCEGNFRLRYKGKNCKSLVQKQCQGNITNSRNWKQNFKFCKPGRTLCESVAVERRESNHWEGVRYWTVENEAGEGEDLLTMGHVKANTGVWGVWELVTVKGTAETESGGDELLAGGSHGWEPKDTLATQGPHRLLICHIIPQQLHFAHKNSIIILLNLFNEEKSEDKIKWNLKSCIPL